MSLRYGLLGLLAEGPASGYDLSRRFEATLNVVWPASHPQIYNELSKLAEDGLIKAAAEGPRGRKAYTITPAGLDAVKAWLKTNKIDRSLRSESLFRSFFFWLMEPEDLMKHLETEKAFFQSRAELYKQISAAKEKGEYGDSPQTKSARQAIEAGARLYAVLADWAEWVKKQNSKG